MPAFARVGEGTRRVRVKVERSQTGQTPGASTLVLRAFADEKGKGVRAVTMTCPLDLAKGVSHSAAEMARQRRPKIGAERPEQA